MSVDELRVGLARIAATVVPDEDPYGRLLRQARRRRRRRLASLGAALAALLTATLAGPGLLGAAGPDPTADDIHGHPVDSAWTWRLVDSPTRGNLAGDTRFLAELTGRLRSTDRLSVAPELSTVKVLWADDSTGLRSVVLAYHSDTAAALVSLRAAAGTPPGELVRGGTMEANLPAEPFVALDVSHDEHRRLLGLAPTGCILSYDRSGRLSGAMHRRWQPAPDGDHLMVEHTLARGWWRVECDGRLRQAGPIQPHGWGIDTAWRRAPGVRPDPAVTAAWPTVRGADIAYRNLVDLSGLVGASLPEVRWAGRLDGDEAVLAGTAGRDSPLVLQVGTGGGGLVALAPAGQAGPDTPRADEPGQGRRPLVATGVTVAYDVAAVRVPAVVDGYPVLTDRLLVVPRPTAVRVEAVADGRVRATAPVRDGAAVLTLPLGARVTLRAVDGTGAVVGSGLLREPAHGERLFDEPLVRDW
ncbi:hypothetical protein [Micromonospora coxensis]|uniref:Uncharacterized protein n=1 Tax=Micromonospora coxensis TaxID=356852 RepID=A0A1C5HT17_9ACTN|nr:hypothetical protein [Micromonospora coxensis]SCG48741.1 hypothetical protein GA0070614_1694 [Micromonospora coxensis]